MNTPIKYDYAAMRKCGYTALAAFIKATTGLSPQDKLEVWMEDEGELPYASCPTAGPVAPLP